MFLWPPNASLYASSTCRYLRLLASPFDQGLMGLLNRNIPASLTAKSMARFNFQQPESLSCESHDFTADSFSGRFSSLDLQLTHLAVKSPLLMR